MKKLVLITAMMTAFVACNEKKAAPAKVEAPKVEAPAVADSVAPAVVDSAAAVAPAAAAVAPAAAVAAPAKVEAPAAEAKN